MSIWTVTLLHQIQTETIFFRLLQLLLYNQCYQFTDNNSSGSSNNKHNRINAHFSDIWLLLLLFSSADTLLFPFFRHSTNNFIRIILTSIYHQMCALPLQPVVLLALSQRLNKGRTDFFTNSPEILFTKKKINDKKRNYCQVSIPTLILTPHHLLLKIRKYRVRLFMFHTIYFR